MITPLLNTIFGVQNTNLNLLIARCPVKDGLDSRQVIFDAPRTAFKQKTDLHWQNVKALSQSYKAQTEFAIGEGKKRLKELEAQFNTAKTQWLAASIASGRQTIADNFQGRMIDCPNAGRNVFVEQQLANANATAQNIYNDKIAASKLPGFKPTAGWLAAANKALNDAKRDALAVYNAAKPTADQLSKAKEDCKKAARVEMENATANFNSPVNMNELKRQADLGAYWQPYIDELKALRQLPVDRAYESLIMALQNGLGLYADYIKSIYEVCGIPVPQNWSSIKNPPIKM